MIQLVFPLNITLDSPRPIFKAFINGVSFKCMLDTGADIPVFCKGELLFRELTKDMEGVSEFKASSIGGFGRNDEEAVLWNIGDFVLSDKNSSITYKEMKVAVVDKPKELSRNNLQIVRRIFLRECRHKIRRIAGYVTDFALVLSEKKTRNIASYFGIVPKIPCDMILSASMFMKMKYVIDCSLRKHTLTIMADRNVYGVGYYNRKETIYIFSGK